MRNFILITLVFLPWLMHAQNKCIYDKPKRLDKFSYDFNSEYGGLLLNGTNLSSDQIQIEVNSYISSLNNSYDEDIYAGFLQLRYGYSNELEFQAGGYVQNPYTINDDTLYNQRYYAGIKYKFIDITGGLASWKLGSSGKYIFQPAGQNDSETRHGILLSLNNTLCWLDVLHLEFGIGSRYYLNDSELQPFLSGRFAIKNKKSKVGAYLGFSGDHFTESVILVGIDVTDNRNFILSFGAGFLDQAISPSVSYTHIFGNYY